jgi:two-component sensor histidine kinase
MTLHEAIEKVLIETKRHLTAKELALLINKKELYQRNDGLAVSASQVTARVTNYPNLFAVNNALISLNNKNEEDIELLEIRQNLFAFLDKIRSKVHLDELTILGYILTGVRVIDENNGSTGHLNQFEKRINQESGVGPFIQLFQDDVFENYLLCCLSFQAYSNRNKLLQKLIYWVHSDRSLGSLFILPEYLNAIIGGLDLFRGNIIFHTHAGMLNNFKLNIFENNPDGNYHHAFLSDWASAQISRINALLLSTSKYGKHDEISSVFDDVGVFTPQWGLNDKNAEWTSNYSAIMDAVYSTNNRLSKVVLIVPEGALFVGGKDQKARKILTELNIVEQIVSLPFISKSVGIRAVSLIVFNFKKEHEDVLLADFNQAEMPDIEHNWIEIVNLLNTNQEIHHVSKKVNINEIEFKDYSWSPTRYIFDTQSLEVKENHKSFLLGDLLVQIKKGYNVDRKKLYEGGEIKYLKTSDLDQDDIYLKLYDNLLGLDPDEFDKPIEPFKDSLVVSFVGSKLKPTVIPENELLVFNHNLAVLTLKTELVIPEFLALELKQDYIEKQLLEKRTGATIPFLTIKSFISLTVQIPSLEIQKDIIIQRSKERNLSTHFPNNSISDLSRTILHNYLGIIKHTMKQPLATLAADIKNLTLYLQRKEQENVLNLSEFLVELLPGEKENDNEQSRVVKTLDRLTRAIADAHWRFEQSETLLKIETADIRLRKENIKDLLSEITRSYTDIEFSIEGENHALLLDKNLWSILIDNLIDNARKHGFINQQERKVLFDIQLDKNSEDNDVIIIYYYNNGQPLPSNFDSVKFISNGVGTNMEAGDGFGGYLINNILKKHNGSIEIVPTEELVLNQYNVCFKLTLNAF